MWNCKLCMIFWHYKVDRCPRCMRETQRDDANELVVQGITKVSIPSVEHPEVPYFNLLLKDNKGNLYIRKSSKEYEIGELFSDAVTKKGKIVGVVGTGVMGTGLVQTLAEAGFSVIWKSRSKEALDSGMKKIDELLNRSYDQNSKKNIMENITGVTEFADLAMSDIIVECAAEDMAVKKELLEELSALYGGIIATNTSSLSVNELSKSVKNPERFIGLHFFNPVKKLQLVEIVLGDKTSKKAKDTCLEFSAEINKTAVVVKDSPLFIVNRVLFPYLIEAVRIYMEGMPPEDIDKAVKLGLNYPIGPIALIDMIGVDVFLDIIRSNKGASDVAQFAEKMVHEGRLGRKSGSGFYNYK